MVDLFSEIGGCSAIEELTEPDLSKVIREIPGIIDSWLQMSEDNRSTPAWYFRKSNKSNKWEVGYYPNGKIIYFDDPIDACSKYILNYLEQIGSVR